ncbi:hypothetical protein H1R20_g13931, partial [Candolleomyces eurysporus]
MAVQHHVCHNADLADFCLQVSFLMRRVAPDQFFYLLNANDDEWSWLSDGIPTVRFQGFQSTGDPVLAVAREVFSSHAARALREEAEILEAAEAPEGPLPDITSLVSDGLNLRSMAQIAAAQADDLIKMTEAKVGTLSLVMQRVYARRGDAGLNDYFRNVRGFSELLEFAHRVPLDTPMLFPRRLNATTMQPDEVEYRWSTDYEDSIYFRPPAASDDEMEVDPASGPAPPDEDDDLGEGPSTQPAAASSSAPAASSSNVNPLIGLAAKRRRGE